MTEKKRYFYDSKQVTILKDGEFWLDGQIDTACNHSEICNELNQLSEENEQLKSENMMVTGANKILKENNKRLKEEIKDFQDLLAGKEEELLKPIIRMIDDRIAHYKHKPISAPISNPVNPKYDADVDRLARLSELQQLKKELKGDDGE